jgi:protein KTI12
MCGHPASGKTSAVADLRARLEAKGRRVVVVDEPGLRLRRDDAYADARAEKSTRGLLKATVERALYRDGPVVVLDAGNGIKGYRYELWCLARQAQTRFCVVHCDTPPEEARERNDARRRSRGEDSPPAADAFSKAIFDDLVFRFRRRRTDGTRRCSSSGPRSASPPSPRPPRATTARTSTARGTRRSPSPSR